MLGECANVNFVIYAHMDNFFVITVNLLKINKSQQRHNWLRIDPESLLLLTGHNGRILFSTFENIYSLQIPNNKWFITPRLTFRRIPIGRLPQIVLEVSCKYSVNPLRIRNCIELWYLKLWASMSSIPLLSSFSMDSWIAPSSFL